MANRWAATGVAYWNALAENALAENALRRGSRDWQRQAAGVLRPRPPKRRPAGPRSGEG